LDAPLTVNYEGNGIFPRMETNIRRNIEVGDETVKTKGEIEKQLSDARKDNRRDPSPRTLGYIEALEWVLDGEKKRLN
jgi:hypothetical protein